MVATGRRYGNFTAVSKAMMRIIGLDLGPVRPPLVELSDEQLDRLRRDLGAMGFPDFCCK
jgi:dihydrodipicolinate synthase/N-acetylneuraminate lyase